MSRIAYVNGRYVPHRRGMVHIEDRGYQFADGVYEVVAIADGRLIDDGPHLDRLERSLRELRIAPPMPRRALELVMREVIRRNGVQNGIIYVQMTRGVAPRDHAFPAKPRTQVVMTARRSRPPSSKVAEEGVKVVTLPDIRWGRCDIKSISLLPNILAKQTAKEAGAYEAWLVDRNGMVTEGSSSNAWIVTRDGKLVTRSIENAILAGITRQTVIALAREEGVELVERPFTVAEAKAAREAFVTSSSSLVTPVTQIDDQVVANGRPGSVSAKLRERYLRYMAGEAISAGERPSASSSAASG